MEYLDSDLLLRLLRAASKEHDVVLGESCQLAECDRARIVAIGLSAVVFQRPGHMHAVGGCAKGTKSLGRFGILSGDEIDLSQHTAHQRADTAIARETVVTVPAV